MRCAVLTISDTDEKLSYLAGLKGPGLGLADDLKQLPMPFLDPAVTNFSLGLADRHKVRGLRKDIARVKTIARQRHMAATEKP